MHGKNILSVKTRCIIIIIIIINKKSTIYNYINSNIRTELTDSPTEPTEPTPPPGSDVHNGYPAGALHMYGVRDRAQLQGYVTLR